MRFPFVSFPRVPRSPLARFLSRKPWLPRGVTAIAFALVASCSSPPPPKPAGPPAPSALSATALSRGMSTNDIIQRIGKPSEVRPMKDHPEAEVWVYYRNLPPEHTMTAASTRDIPVVDPLTGQMKTQQELVYHPEEIQRVQRTELLVMQNMLVSYKQYIETKRRYD